MKKNPYYNSEGYPDPTACYGTKGATREGGDQKARELIKVLKFIIRSAGFDLIDRIALRDRKTGREYR